MIKETAFQGLSTAPADHESADGEMATLYNLVPEDGHLKPVTLGDDTFSIPDYCEFLIVHVNSGFKHFIVKCLEDGVLHYYWLDESDDPWNDSKTELTDLEGFEVNATTQIGNIVCFVGDKDTKYAYWQGAETGYTIFDNSMFAYTLSLKREITNAADDGDLDDLDTRIKNTYTESSPRMYDHYQFRLSDDEWPTDEDGNLQKESMSGEQMNSFFQIMDGKIAADISDQEDSEHILRYITHGVAAVKLYDGSYISISDIFTVAPQMSLFQHCVTEYTTGHGGSVTGYEGNVNTGYGGFQVYFRNKRLEFDNQLYKAKITIGLNDRSFLDLIQSIDIFITTPQTYINFKDSYQAVGVGERDSGGEQSAIYDYAFKYLEGNDLYDAFDLLSFRKSISITREELEVTPVVSKYIKEIAGTEEAIDLSDLRRSTFGGRQAIAYNNRLHLGDTTVVKNVIEGMTPGADVHNPLFNYIYRTDSPGNWDGRWNIPEHALTPSGNFLGQLADNDHVGERYIEYTQGSTGVCSLAVRIYLKDVYGAVKTVCYKVENTAYPLQPIFCYPDSRAFKADLYLYLPDLSQNGNRLSRYYKLEGIPLHQSTTFGMSYWICTNYNSKFTAETVDWDYPPVKPTGWPSGYTPNFTSNDNISSIFGRFWYGELSAPMAMNQVSALWPYTVANVHLVQTFAPFHLFKNDSSWQETSLSRMVDNGNGFKTFVYDPGIKFWTECSDSTDYDSIISQIDSSDFSETNEDMVRVSDAENPFVFPAENSVTVGSQIIGLMTNTEAVSQGQFGQYPMYAFTLEGIWALNIDLIGSDLDENTQATAGAYSSRTIISREKAYANTLSTTGNEVLFASDRGLMFIKGATVKCLSEQLDGWPFDFNGLEYSKEILASRKIYQEDGIYPVNTTPFLPVKYHNFKTDFLKGCKITYDYATQRIYLYNPTLTEIDGESVDAYPYTYILSLKSMQWGCMGQSMHSQIAAAGTNYVVLRKKVNGTYVNMLTNVYHNSEDNTTIVPVFACTRPLSYDARNIHKTVSTTILRGMFRNYQDTYNSNGEVDKHLSMVLYGSNDLYHWFLINTSVDQYLRGRSGTPYKFFRIAFIGNLQYDESVYGISTDITTRLNNQLR